MSEYLSLFLAKGNRIQIKVLQTFVKKLRNIAAVLKELRGYRFISSSICLMYDFTCPSRNDIRLIDFGRLVQENESFWDE